VAREKFKGLLVSPANVKYILDPLQFTNRRPEMLINSQMNMVNQITPLSENNLKKIVIFASKIDN